MPRPGGCAPNGSRRLCEDIAWLHKDKRDILVVSSGAIALGRSVLKLRRARWRWKNSQAAAAVGQIALARVWAQTLGAHGITAGQILVTLGDTEERRRYLNARSTIDKLLEWKSVPVINENDTVATTEIRYGDNDRLAARVATMMSADLLVLLSDIDGLYDAPPGGTTQANLVPVVERITPEIESDGGSVGLRTVARRHGDQDRGRQDRDQCRHPHGDRVRQDAASVARDRGRRALHLVSDARQSGHRAQAMDRGLARAERHRCISMPARSRRLRRGASLLPAGVKRCDGAFQRGDAVVIRSLDGVEIGRGLVAYDAADAVADRRPILGGNPQYSRAFPAVPRSCTATIWC